MLTLFVIFVPSIAWGHEIGISRGQYAVEKNVIVANLVFARGDVMRLSEDIDADNDGDLSATEIAAATSTITTLIIKPLRVSTAGESCPGWLEQVELTEEDGLAIVARYECETAGRVFDVRAGFVHNLSSGHRHLVQGSGAVAYRGNELIKITPGQSQDASVGLFELFKFGIVHILIGWDHLVFLLGLILIGGRMKSMVAVVTAFTIGHSVTLGLAALRIWVPAGEVIEPLIALSIVYVGVENFFVKDISKRWYLTGLFGLIHGFGFAGVLAEVGLPESGVLGALLSFNLGVEAGQIAVLLAVVPILVTFRKEAWFREQGVRVVNIAIILLGLFWFFDRIL